MKTLRSQADIKSFFEANDVPIFYISKTPYNALGLPELIKDFWCVAEADFFDGQARGMFAPPDVGCASTFEEANARLLASEATRAFVASKGGRGKALFLMFDEENERAARALGLELGLPSAALRSRLDDKLTTTRMGDEAGIRSVPNVISKIDGYATLRREASHLGEDLVIQLPYGDSGQTTYFVSDEATYAKYAAPIEAQAAVKVMRRIACKQAAIEACVTRHGVVIGPLATELVGFRELTPYRGGWCGNEIAVDAFPPGIIEQARDITRRFGAVLAQRGYRGCFGLDFLIDERTGAVFLGELNPRITGVAPLTTQVARDQGNVPLLLLHLLEWLDVDYVIDVEELNALWERLDATRGWSQLIIKHTGEAQGTIVHAPPSGRYRMDTGGVLHDPQGTSLLDVAGPHEALVMRTMEAGWSYGKGDCIARLATPGRVMTPDYELDPRATAWIDATRALFTMT